MPAFKATILMQCVTGSGSPPQRAAGFSESWYFNGSATGLMQALIGVDNINLPGVPISNGLLTLRAALLPVQSGVIGVRTQSVDPVGLATTLKIGLPGTSGYSTDYPSLGLQISCPAKVGRGVRRGLIRNIPDTLIWKGEFLPLADYVQSLGLYFAALDNFAFRGKDLSSNLSTKLIGITSGGLVSAAQNVTLQPGITTVMIKPPIGKAKPFLVTAIGPLASQFTVADWTEGAVSGGTATIKLFQFSNINGDGITTGSISTRRVGRPFEGFRGRRSKKTQA